MRIICFLVLSLAVFTRSLCNGATEVRSDAERTLVVFNSRDTLSADLAKYYAGRRNIPADHVVGLDCPTDEEISRWLYDQTIAEPLRKILTDRGFWKIHKDSSGKTIVDENQIRFVALIRGIPLKIAPLAEKYAGDEPAGPTVFSGKNEACVDSELACLGFYSRVISGPLMNPYYKRYDKISDANMPPLMLVCRLDAPTTDIVRSMIDDSIAAEKGGLWGFAYIDSRNIAEGGLAQGDKWLDNIAADARKHGIPVIQDNGPDVFPADYPMRHAAFYYGWYTDNVYGPFLRPDFHFDTGGIACHIHSFSASTIRDQTKFWAGPLVARGAVAVLGNVYEPYLALTSNLDIFHARIEDGFTFAESAYMSTPVLSWMNTFIGDPLYKPFNLVDNNFESLPKPQAEWAAYRIGAVSWYKDGRAVGEKKLQKSAHDLRSGIIYESLGLLQAGENDFTAALVSFQLARKFYKDDDDIIRTAIHEVSILRAMNRIADAHGLVKTVLKTAGSAPSAELLRKLDAEMNPTPAPTAPAGQ